MTDQPISTEDGFPPAERKLITQSYDLSLSTLVDQWHDEQIILPEIQREYVWDNARASRLIESLLLNIPIPVLYFAEDDTARWEIYDGHQRVKSIVRYLSNEFALTGLSVMNELGGHRYRQLPAREQRFLRTRMIRAVVIANDSHPNMKFEIFERLNTGAIVLNPQELRNSLYRGDFNRLLQELVRDSNFRRSIGTKAPRRRMVDQEFILRFFALRDQVTEYRPPLKRFLNNYMRGVKNATTSELNSLRATFQRTSYLAHSIFGPGAYRVWDSEGKPIEKGPNRALFDAQMLALSWVEDDDVLQYKNEIQSSFSRLFTDEEFMDAIRLATSDKSRTLSRTRKSIAVFRDLGLTVRAPDIDQ